MELSSDLEKGVPIYGKKKEWNELKNKNKKEVGKERKCVGSFFENFSGRD